MQTAGGASGRRRRGQAIGGLGAGLGAESRGAAEGGGQALTAWCFDGLEITIVITLLILIPALRLGAPALCQEGAGLLSVP